MRPAALEMEYFRTLHKLPATRTFGGQQRPMLCAAQSYGGTLGSTSKVRVAHFARPHIVQARVSHGAHSRRTRSMSAMAIYRQEHA